MTQNKYTLVLFALAVGSIMSACATSEKESQKTRVKTESQIEGQWFLTKVAFDRYNAKDKNVNWQTVLNTAQQACEQVALNAPIKKPRCRTVAPVRNCQPFGRTVGGDFCAKPFSNNACPIGEVQKYQDELKRAYNDCMADKGWEFQPYGDAPQPLQPIIDTIPELVEWQQKDWTKWKLVAKFDAELAAKPEYEKIPVRDRLLKVVELVKAHFTDSNQQRP
ncbi:hypothetical protein FLL45_03910 [Aliikangiella marina]|uniref:Uncharacterized protein n=1 Tax=Aliikangiella marina TaxID=1712262 RepID=A0A545TIQ6_9GAMM|nr:hypothetical protein [Aliikangiella marina]TQV77105.1 hypothetical protein FLL45_03910 [Aliikangiella marina]